MAVDRDYVVKQTVEGITLPEGIPAEPQPGEIALAGKMRDWFQLAWDADSEFRTAADEDFKFVNSDQWEPEVKKLLESMSLYDTTSLPMPSSHERETGATNSVKLLGVGCPP